MSVWNQEWLNQNANRAYPFREDTSRRDTSGGAIVPDQLIVDLVFVVPEVPTNPDYYLRQLLFASPSLVLIFADTDGNTVSSVTVDVTTHTPNTTYDMVGQGAFQDARGRIAIGDLADVEDALGPGAYSFTSSATLLEARTVRPDLRGVRQIQVVDGAGNLSEPIQDIVQMLAGTNIRLTYVPATYLVVPDPETGVPINVLDTPAGIRIDAISGENLNEDCPCEDAFPLPDPIRTLMGISPDENGNIDIVAGTPCLSINTSPGLLEIQDDCTEDCCGCTELEALLAGIAALEGTVNSLERRQIALDDSYALFQTNVIGTLS